MVPDELLADPGRPSLRREPGASDLLLKPDARLLHIGPHKTGTTAIQGAFDLARARLAAYGVGYSGAGRQPLLPALAVTGQPALLGGMRPDIDHWKKLAREIRQAVNQRVLVSSEFFAGADDAAARRIIEDLGGTGVHVVVTLRPAGQDPALAMAAVSAERLLHALSGLAGRDTQQTPGHADSGLLAATSA